MVNKNVCEEVNDSAECMSQCWLVELNNNIKGL